MPISVIILAAGQGKRMRSALPKVLQFPDRIDHVPEQRPRPDRIEKNRSLDQ